MKTLASFLPLFLGTVTAYNWSNDDYYFHRSVTSPAVCTALKCAVGDEDRGGIAVCGRCNKQESLAAKTVREDEWVHLGETEGRPSSFWSADGRPISSSDGQTVYDPKSDVTFDQDTVGALAPKDIQNSQRNRYMLVQVLSTNSVKSKSVKDLMEQCKVVKPSAGEGEVKRQYEMKMTVSFYVKVTGHTLKRPVGYEVSAPLILDGHSEISREFQTSMIRDKRAKQGKPVKDQDHDLLVHFTVDFAKSVDESEAVMKRSERNIFLIYPFVKDAKRSGIETKSGYVETVPVTLFKLQCFRPSGSKTPGAEMHKCMEEAAQTVQVHYYCRRSNILDEVRDSGPYQLLLALREAKERLMRNATPAEFKRRWKMFLETVGNLSTRRISSLQVDGNCKKAAVKLLSDTLKSAKAKLEPKKEEAKEETAGDKGKDLP